MTTGETETRGHACARCPHVVLIAPEIPQNTGTIGRLCVCAGAPLHLIRPLGFELSESRIRRAGLDYWQHLDLQVHEDWERFLREAAPRRMVFATAHAERTVYDIDFQAGDFLVFGNETSGLPSDFYRRYADSLATIPMPGPRARTHNLANAASIVLYEAIRQTGNYAQS